MSCNLDWGDQVSAHGVQVDWDLNGLLVHVCYALSCHLCLTLLDVHPLEIDARQVCLQLFSKLEAFIFDAIFSTLHSESGQDESLRVLLDLSICKIDLKLEL